MNAPTTTAADNVLRTEYQRSVAAYWNHNQQDPVNLRLGDIDGLYHHHHGLGEYDPAVLEEPADTRDERIIGEMHRLEAAQADVLLDHLGDGSPSDRLLDAGSGRGGTSFMASQRFGSPVDGVSISEYQVGFANRQAEERGVAQQVRFHFRNMLDTGFETGSRRAIWTNETTMYVDLFELFAEFARPAGARRAVRVHHRLLQRRDRRPLQGSEPDRRALHVQHPPPKRVLQGDGGQQPRPDQRDRPDGPDDPYWELRAASSVATGIEDPFLTAYREGSFHYLLIAADRI